MNYDTFKKLIMDRIATELGSSNKVHLEVIEKNNGICLDGLVIIQEAVNIAPTLYLNYYYEHYVNGATFEQVYQNIMDTYRTNRQDASIDTDFFCSYENVKQRIVYKVINYEKNKTLLKKIPYVRFLDLAIVFYCLVTPEKDSFASILIHNQHLSFWNADANQLLELAKKNTPRLLPYVLKPMKDMVQELSEFLSLGVDASIEESDFPMYILTNQSRTHGASCILYKNVLQDLANEFDSDLYILPSSIHEVILFPGKNHSNMEEYSEMVQQVNGETVDTTEILSDHVYYYSRKNDCISM